MSSDPSAPGQLLVISAPSGAGKTTLARRFVSFTPGARFSISATTRPPRGAERDGVDYHFLSAEDFAARVAAGDFAEWAEVHGRRYGTLRSTVEEALRAGAVAVFDIDVQGGAQILDRWPEAAVSVLVVPPSPAELERRLRGRSTESDEAIRLRLAAAHTEVARAAARYAFVIVNDRVDDALERLVAISRSARARRGGATADPGSAIAESCRTDRADLSAWIP
ncbi:MAG: guanylate kinase [Deltaproteobacteria bacterium]